MPYQSEAQRRYLKMNLPEVAKEFDKKTPKNTKLPPKKGYVSTSDGMMKVAMSKADQQEVERMHRARTKLPDTGSKPSKVSRAFKAADKFMKGVGSSVAKRIKK